ncbi:TetR/AcrR family transcriptional regulator [Solirubrobacter soli]|uniref:TetR/AcrR family transcriptional regulator n=1 Tax=Solirubrobacter soli TaxID=363832 RepID=UPI0003F4D7EE|nr:TetR/AcrR family transcriptional regulator [Solirubrobacter soli]
MPVAKGEPLDPAATRQRILDAASRVLYEKGTLAVGVNELAAEAGVSKVTLYRHFDSKDALVSAYLRARSERVSAWLREVSQGLDARARILALFDALERWFADPAFNGCALVNGAIEARGAQTEARAIAAAHLDRYLDLLQELTGDGEALARQLLLLVEGARTVAFVKNDPTAARDAKAAAEALLEQAARGPQRAR